MRLRHLGRELTFSISRNDVDAPRLNVGAARRMACCIKHIKNCFLRDGPVGEGTGGITSADDAVDRPFDRA